MNKEEMINRFNEKINWLINNTPTGEVRNEITDLNILFNILIKQYEKQ